MDNEEYYDGVYEFGRVGNVFNQRPGRTGKEGQMIELAPGVDAEILNERVSLCHTSRQQTHRCFWEGDLELTLLIQGRKVVINDHDEDRTPFIYNGVQYHVIGHRHHLDDDDIVRLRYTVYRHSPI